MRRLAPLAVALLLAGCAGPAPLGEPDQSSEYPQKLAPESFYKASFSLASRSHVRVTVNVTSGGPVDAWLAGGAACDRWLQGDFAPERTLFGVANGTLEADLDAGDYCLPLDNAAIPPGPTQPTGEVQLTYRIETWRI